MADKTLFGCAETGTYQTSAPNPHIDLSGTASSSYSIAQLFADAMSSDETATVSIVKDKDNWAIYGGAKFTNDTVDTLDLSVATLLESKGTLSDEDAVTCLGLAPRGIMATLSEAPTTGDITTLTNRHYRIDPSGLTGYRYLILPSGAIDGDVISWELTAAAPAAYELILKGDTGVTVTLRGTSATAAEVTRYFIEGETGRAVFDGTEWRINKADDGRIPFSCSMNLTTSADGETVGVFTAPTSATTPGAWTVIEQTGAVASAAASQILIRRACRGIAALKSKQKDTGAINGHYARLINSANTELLFIMCVTETTWHNGDVTSESKSIGFSAPNTLTFQYRNNHQVYGIQQGYASFSFTETL